MIVAYDTYSADDPLNDQDMTVAAVGQAIESGELDRAETFVEKRATIVDDQVQDTIEDLVENGLPEDAATNPLIHPGIEPPASTAPSGATIMSAAASNPYSSTSYKFKMWQKTTVNCGCAAAEILTSVKFWLKSSTYSGDLQLDAGMKVTIGDTRVHMNEGRCRLRRENSGADTSIFTWSNCEQFNTLGHPKMSRDITSKNKVFGGVKNEEYHNDLHVRVNPEGSYLDAKDVDFRGKTFSYDSSGGSPTFD